MPGSKRLIALAVVALLGLAACGEHAAPEATNVIDTGANPPGAPTPDTGGAGEAGSANSTNADASPPTSAPPRPASTAACMMQDGERLTMTPLRAIGTEPFWGARIEGRCVTYSTPEDQAGTRVWTTFNPGPDGGIWSGALGGRQFELRTRPAPPPGCSDGMSDNLYPHVGDAAGARRNADGILETALELEMALDHGDAWPPRITRSPRSSQCERRRSRLLAWSAVKWLRPRRSAQKGTSARMRRAGDRVLVDAVIGGEHPAGDVLVVARRGDRHQIGQTCASAAKSGATARTAASSVEQDDGVAIAARG